MRQAASRFSIPFLGSSRPTNPSRSRAPRGSRLSVCGISTPLGIRSDSRARKSCSRFRHLILRSQVEDQLARRNRDANLLPQRLEPHAPRSAPALKRAVRSPYHRPFQQPRGEQSRDRRKRIRRVQMNHVGPSHLFRQCAEQLERHRLARDARAVPHFDSVAMRVCRHRRRVQPLSPSVRIRRQHPNRHARARQMPRELVRGLGQPAVNPRRREERSYVQDAQSGVVVRQNSTGRSRFDAQQSDTRRRLVRIHSRIHRVQQMDRLTRAPDLRVVVEHGIRV